MNPRDEQFVPETIDEQIDWLTRIQAQHDTSVSNTESTDNARLIHELHAIAYDDTQRLTHIRKRLADAYEAGKGAQATSISPDSLQHSQKNQQPQTQFRQPLVAALSPSNLHSSTPPQPVRRDKRQRFIPMLSSLVAVLVIASMVTILIVNNARVATTHLVQLTATRSALLKKTPKPRIATPPGYYTNQGEIVFKADTRNGTTLWHYHVPSSESFSPRITVYTDAVYAVAYDGVYALDAVSGSVRWSHPFPDTRVSPPIVSNNTLYVASKQGIYTLNIDDGKLLRTYMLPGSDPIGDIAVIGNALYYVHDKSIVSTINLDNGQELWHKQVAMNSNEFLMAMQTTNDAIYIKMGLRPTSTTEGQSYLLALLATTGEQLWKSATTLNDSYIFTVDNDVIYYGTRIAGMLHAYNIKTGKELWHKSLGLLIYTMTLADAHTLCILIANPAVQTSYTSGLVVVDTQDGGAKWQYPSSTQQMLQGKQTVTDLAVQHDTIYVHISPDDLGAHDETYALTVMGMVIWHKSLAQQLP